MAEVANGITHHDPNGSSDLQGLQDEIKTLVNQVVGEETLDMGLLVDEQGNWQECKEEETTCMAPLMSAVSNGTVPLSPH